MREDGNDDDNGVNNQLLVFTPLSLGGLFLSNRHLEQGLDKPHAVASLFLPKVQ